MELVKVYTARDAMEAHFLKGLLEQDGIDATVMGESLAIARGDLPVTPETLPSVWVRQEDAARAAPIVDVFIDSKAEDEDSDEDSVDDLDSWTCSRCGESVEGQFTDCWNCEAPRPEETE